MFIKQLSVALLLCALTVGVAQAADMTERSVLDGKVTLLTPKDFNKMSEDMMKTKYPSENRPSEVLTNKDGSVNLTFNHSASKIPSDINALHKPLSDMFHKMYAGATWVDDKVVDVNGRKFIAFEVITPAVDSKIHNIIYITELNGTMLLISFNATEKEVPAWLEVGKQMMSSIKIK